MLDIDKQGMVFGNARIRSHRFPLIERGPMATVSGIIVHQTGSSNAQSTFNSYRLANANGAHFLIDKDGAIYQTASVLQRANHVGRLRARCLAEHSCNPAEIIQYKKSSDLAMHKMEMLKTTPSRYPSNLDSIGIEIVGEAHLPPGVKAPTNPEDRKRLMANIAVYEALTVNQTHSLRYLIHELAETLQIKKSEILRHPDVSRKNITEAAKASW